jgi:hypothetical protein
MKIFTKVAVAIYILAGALLIFGNFSFLPDFYQPVLMGSLALVSAFLILLPRAFFRPSGEVQERALWRMQTVIAICLLINGAGGLGLYKLYLIGFQYDKLAHFATSLIFTVGLAYFLRDWFGKRFVKSVAISGTAVLIGGFLWELLEAFSDTFLGTQLVGGGTGNIRRDTTIDIAMNGLGILFAVLYISTKNRLQKEK